ncbi:unnamed protein product [Rotaria sordida]|uniref:Uncharacterized protein n=1 Tax=Rotaria sordida TaxID=392033 RepID=A0A815CI22_9BILA|nr:unnamed protein product [Rotaria sordida]
MERILLATDYPNLTELKISHFQEDALYYFLNKLSLQSIFREQITVLTLINDDKYKKERSLENYSLYVYSFILTLFENLKKLSITGGSFGSSYPGLSLRDLPFTTFSSPILTHLYINVDNFDDCLYLLDGRLRQLTTLCVTVYTVKSSSEIVHNMDKLCNLKYFSLKVSDLFEAYDKISSLFRRMSNLEKLTLNIAVRRRNRVIDGTDIQHDIFDCMPQLHSFTFCICAYVEMVDLSYKLTSEDIQQTLTDIGQQHAVSMVSYVTKKKAACSIFSLPFEFDYLEDLGNKYPNTVFSYVTYLLVRDTVPFEHEFFMRIARSFPSLKHLRIFNMKSQTLNSRMTFSSDNSQLYSIIEYPHLTILDVKYAHRDYVEQFLNEAKAYIPCLTNFEVFVDYLKAVTKNFRREETRRNCAKVERLFTRGSLVRTDNFWLYFPSLYK